ALQDGKSPINVFAEFFQKNHKDKIIIICCSSNYSAQRTLELAREFNLNSLNIDQLSDAKPFVLNISRINIDFSFSAQDFIFISDTNLFGQKLEQTRKPNKKLKNIFKEYENFTEKDLVVHKEHGIGRYEGIETVEVCNVRHDCLKIIYNKGDRLLIPVENAYDIKKYGDGEAQLDSLGGIAWQKRKAALKCRIGEIAVTLLNIAAKRRLVTAQPVNYNMELYRQFEEKFPYVETEDQIKAIEDIIEDLNSTKPMDRLICGDVGFGKTEVAMRAAFLVSESKQVAFIAPTTILAKQHYINFCERLNGFNRRIAHLSRFVSQKDAQKIKQELEDGKIDIIIGTHALFADSLKFNNLGLMIIDEEQHFGVIQKEKLKKMRESIHILTLSATPIPRTLQSSLVGIKELSIIATPPIDRLSVKTHLINFDDMVIRDALLRERFRGGKSFVVAPKVSDLNEIKDFLNSIVPELSLKVAHGGLAPNTIDKIMQEFYEGHLDILLSTAIVESGLDVPSANTMIIFRADMFGLSQLYQLRGRVGRRKVRGYAYLVLDKKKTPTKSARKRLEIMESLDSLGAGFTVASHDMDIRGFGNMIGDEQSGHIKEVGIELYQEMLQEAIERIKDPSYIEKQETCQIKVNIPIYIPDEYIEDSATRLAIYRKAGEIDNYRDIEEFKIELIDRFGSLPQPTQNLINLISLRIKANLLNIKSIDIGPSGITTRFFQNVDADLIMKFVAKYPRCAKIKPDNKLVYLKQMAISSDLKEIENFLELLGSA
ncbi:MAG: transcription-repair coupling factor, partial [Rickettsiaceae bacterium]|nr:transcription-repair coupling factor [Rickettsiaceae bacterium]